MYHRHTLNHDSQPNRGLPTNARETCRHEGRGIRTNDLARKLRTKPAANGAARNETTKQLPNGTSATLCLRPRSIDQQSPYTVSMYVVACDGAQIDHTKQVFARSL